jgi:hypothetical protein
MKKSFRSLALVFVLAALAGGCSTNTQGDDPSPVYLTFNATLLPAVKCVNDGSLLQFDQASLSSNLKGSATGGSSGFMDTQVESYTIVWTRVDGGKTASATETFGGNVVVPAGGQSSLTNYPFMSISALQKPPLNQLFPFNGGVDRETGNSEIRQAGTVTWYGHTMSGQPVSSVPAVFNMTFVYCASTGRVEISRAH